MTRGELKDIIIETMNEIEQENTTSIQESVEALDEKTQELISAYVETVLDEYDEYLVLEAKNPERKKIVKAVKKIIKNAVLEEGEDSASFRSFAIGGENSKFLKGEGNILLIGIEINNSDTVVYSDGTVRSKSNRNADKESLKNIANCIKNNQDEIKKRIKDETGAEVTSIRMAKGRLDVNNIEFVFKF